MRLDKMSTPFACDLLFAARKSCERICPLKYASFTPAGAGLKILIVNEDCKFNCKWADVKMA